MAVTEVFADGIGTVRVVGDTVRIDMVSMSGGGGFEMRVRLVVPTTSLGQMVDILRKAQQSLQVREAAKPASGEVV